MAQAKGTADKLEEWFFANQPSLTPGQVKEAAASVGGHHRLRRAVRPGADAGEDRRRPWRAARREVDADVLHQRPRDCRRAAGRAIRAGHRARAEAIAPVAELPDRRNPDATRAGDVTCPGIRRQMPAAIRIDELTKDYSVGFWRKRPYRALDRLSLEVAARRGLRLSRPERRRQDDDAEAADAADFPDLRARRDPRPAGRRRRRRASASATFPRIRTSTTT